jgi:hypothetical protein
MTTQEKNVEIALMLGATIENWYPANIHTSTSGNYLIFPQGKWYPDNVRQHGDTKLKFHSDANWQFEALEFITKLDLSDRHYNWVMGGQEYNNFSGLDYNIQNNACQIILNLELDPPRDIIQTVGTTAIFEALYQFSQYLKTKK